MSYNAENHPLKKIKWYIILIGWVVLGLIVKLIIEKP